VSGYNPEVKNLQAEYDDMVLETILEGMLGVERFMVIRGTEWAAILEWAGVSVGTAE
jgi:hypothetical protein